MYSIFIILLGCNIYSILNNRVKVSIDLLDKQYSNFDNNVKITWFLSGGIKYQNDNAISEASIMKSHIDNNISIDDTNLQTKFLWKFILDEKSTNTAENFLRASLHLNSTLENYDKIYVVTSDFHHIRARYMLNLIDSSKSFEWILGDLEVGDMRDMESIHIRNVFSDVHTAKNNIIT